MSEHIFVITPPVSTFDPRLMPNSEAVQQHILKAFTAELHHHFISSIRMALPVFLGSVI